MVCGCAHINGGKGGEVGGITMAAAIAAGGRVSGRGSDSVSGRSIRGDGIKR